MSEDGYEGVTVAGIAVVAANTGRVLLAQRAADDSDGEGAYEKWEFPGGHLKEGEDPLTAASREFTEELGPVLPEGEVIDGWRGGDSSEDGHYQGFVYQIAAEMAVDEWEPTDEVQAVGWFDSAGVQELENAGKMREELVATMNWALVFPETEESDVDDAMTAATQVGTAEKYLRTDDEGNAIAEVDTEVLTEDDTDFDAIFAMPIPIHGVIAPEEVATGDKRGFEAGSMTARPYRLPFRHAPADIGAHDGAVPVGSVDRMMRKDGLIHWEGLMMPSENSERLADLMEFFGGRYGVSVDGDNGSLNSERTAKEGVAWFDAVRASGLTAVDIPAFAEAYVAFGPHPEMPPIEDEESLVASGDLVAFKRGPGWITNPADTRRIHRYWTEKGQEGYAKVGWGTPGDFRRAKALIGAKIAKNSPDKVRFLNQIIAQWHFDALGYWPGDLGKPGNAPDTPENRRRAATHAAAEGIELSEDEETAWEAVLVSSASGLRPPIEYFHKHPDTWGTVIEDPDENGFVRTYGYAAEWGVCHIGYGDRCVEPPRTFSDDYPDFHKGRTKVDGGGFVPTGVLTYNVEHRGAKQILTESATQAHFDNLKNAWAAVRIGEDDIGIWFSGVVLPNVPAEDIVKIEASGQVSGEWKYNSLRALLTVNVEGFPVERPSAEYDSQGNVVALAASAHGQMDSDCKESPAERLAALKQVEADEQAEARLAALKAAF